MKINKNARKILVIGAIAAVLPFFQNCDMGSPVKANLSSNVGGEAAAGGGNTVQGVGDFSMPTGPAVISRITNGLENAVSPLKGNFQKALTASGSNLPLVTDPTKASGFDSVQLVVYGACSDLTTGGTNSIMTKTYKVTGTASIASNQANLIAAGVRMFDNYTAGLGSQGPTAAQVSQAFQTLVTTVSGTSSNTSTIAFMSVCIAANTAGSSLLGF